MKKGIIFGISLFILTVAIVYIFVPKARYYTNYLIISDLNVDTTNIPITNKLILNYAQNNGAKIAPTYKSSVCTEYLIKTIQPFVNLSKSQKSKIRIITNSNIDSLVTAKSNISKGIYFALISNNQGIPIENLKDAKAGDLIQFWYQFNGRSVGHCGILRAVNLDYGLISLYSSSPKTNGHGKQIYVLPDFYYVVRPK